MKTYNTIWVLVAVIALLVGGMVGYYAMPEKTITETKVVASDCPAIPVCPTVNVSAVNCTNVDVKDIKPEPKKVLGNLVSTRSCAEWLENQNVDAELPFCWQKKTVLNMTDLNVGCKIVYRYGC